ERAAVVPGRRVRRRGVLLRLDGGRRSAGERFEDRRELETGSPATARRQRGPRDADRDRAAGGRGGVVAEVRTPVTILTKRYERQDAKAPRNAKENLLLFFLGALAPWRLGVHPKTILSGALTSEMNCTRQAFRAGGSARRDRRFSARPS